MAYNSRHLRDTGWKIATLNSARDRKCGWKEGQKITVTNTYILLWSAAGYSGENSREWEDQFLQYAAYDFDRLNMWHTYSEEHKTIQ